MLYPRSILLTSAVAIATAACGSSTPEPQQAETSEAPTTGHHGHGMGVEAEIGGLNESEVASVFNHAQGSLMKCYQSSAASIPYLAGKVQFHVRVGSDGHPSQVFLSESTLGSREAETCMIGVIEGSQFPSPQGGKEGIADSGLTFDPDGDVREPVEWSESDMGKSVKAAHEALESCKSAGGGGALQATLYVSTDGSVQSVGVAGEASAQGAECAVTKLKRLRFNSPGSYAAKITLGA